MPDWISCDFGPGEKFLFCNECGSEALYHHGLEIDDDEIKKVSSDGLNSDAKCNHCSIGKNEG